MTVTPPPDDLGPAELDDILIDGEPEPPAADLVIDNGATPQP